MFRVLLVTRPELYRNTFLSQLSNSLKARNIFNVSQTNLKWHFYHSLIRKLLLGHLRTEICFYKIKWRNLNIERTIKCNKLVKMRKNPLQM